MKSTDALIFVFFCLLFSGCFLGTAASYAQTDGINTSYTATGPSVFYKKLGLRKVDIGTDAKQILSSKELEFEELTLVEENMVKNLDSQWAVPEHTLEMIDSYSPFLFRTRKSRDLKQVKLILHVNAKGRLSGFDIVNKVDKGIKERIDHMLRKLPSFKPVPGFTSYRAESFELTIQK